LITTFSSRRAGVCVVRTNDGRAMTLMHESNNESRLLASVLVF
jgi:hypothetical protein